jgi:hypothetical protein
LTFLLYDPDPCDGSWILILDVPSTDTVVDSTSFVKDVEVDGFEVEPLGT